ncbi:tumor necrosis factor receptor superfamily member 13B [Egretta garzetta]|uniref:tumor necrosis factor receptor superfamily member 13B n=1 Tax=Egretta garzetta TaxID=188379 RepID=UPI00051EEC38|nr:tumor necrosis factor receptor superfamily member 13B [Egretta garzetta]
MGLELKWSLKAVGEGLVEDFGVLVPGPADVDNHKLKLYVCTAALWVPCRGRHQGAVITESMDCNRRAGFYYDKLLKKCINCTTVCGQHPKQCAPSCEDRLVEAGSVGDGSTGSRVPEPVETCGFCFPGHGSAVQETKSCHSTSYHIGERAAPSHTGICSTGSAGAIPSPDDGHFKIICSPSQEKTLTA